MHETVLICGASGDIGQAIARRFDKEGYRIAIHYHSNQEAAEALAAELSDAHVYQADLTDSESVNKLIETIHDDFKTIDCLINNAGALNDALLTFMSDEQWQSSLDLNLSGAFYSCRAVAMIMARQRHGKIVNISSDAGRLGAAGRSNYAAAKAGLAAFGRSIAMELAGSGVQVNTVSPGFIESRMTADINDVKKKALLREIPGRRFGSPEDVAGLVYFLCSAEADYITGQEISVDGGLYKG